MTQIHLNSHKSGEPFLFPSIVKKACSSFPSILFPNEAASRFYTKDFLQQNGGKYHFPPD